jgi:hypothetical protein
MSEEHEHVEQAALRAANLALAGKQRREAHRFASIELRLVDPRANPWEFAAMAAVALGGMVVALGVWLL